MSAEMRLHREIERSADAYVDLLRRLVQTPSEVGSEAPCQAIVREHMSELGIFERDVYPGRQPPFWPTDRSYDGRPCVVGRLGSGPGPSFILNAHVDTAPVEDPASWTFAPFSGHAVDGKLYGRGALDDKAGVAMMLMLAGCLRRSGLRLPGTLLLESVIEDEDSGNGTLACLLAGYHGDAAIVIDGTWPSRIIDAHLGQVWAYFVFRGESAAAGSHRRVVNPTDAAIRAIHVMREEMDRRNRSTPRWEVLEAPFFVNVGRMSSGHWAGSVPEVCRLEIQAGFPPPHTPEGMVEVLCEIVRKAVEGMGEVSWEVRLGNLGAPPFSNRNNEMVRLLSSTIRRLRGDEYPVQNVAVMGHCDLRHLRAEGGGLSQACLYGPGGGCNPHGRDEHYFVDDFIPVAQNIGSAVLKWFCVE